jgi:multicomponent Na+:H+ antiporter subunit D
MAEAYGGVDRAAAMVTAPVAATDWIVVAPVLLPIIFGALLLMFRHRVRLHAAVSLAALLAVGLCNVALLTRVLRDGPLVMTMGGWLPPFGISFTADLLGALMSLTATLAAVAALLFSFRDIDATGRRYGFYPFLLLMMAGVNGAFLTGDIFNLYVWFEVFLISSFGLLILGSEPEQIDGATKYAVLNLIATTLFLITTGLLYGVFGTLNMADIARKSATIGAGAPLMTLGALFLVAFSMKAAAFPLNFWLPASYHTPKIVTAALFAGLLTKVGVYALLRVLAMLFPLERAAMSELIAWIAGVTMVLGVMGALVQSDIRRLLGFIVISGVGIMIAGIAIGGAEALAGVIFYAIHSVLTVTGLYLLAGMMKEAGGSFSLAGLSGLYAARPLLAGAMLALMFASAGLPPFIGVWPKVVIVQAALESGAGWLAFAILLNGFLTVLALGRVFSLAFWRNEAQAGFEPASTVARATLSGYVPLGILLAPIVLFGVYPEPLLRISMLAAAGLIDPAGYIGAVFPGGAVP